jgi:hypothetical protein
MVLGNKNLKKGLKSMKPIALTVTLFLVLSLTGCGQLTKLLQEEIANNTTKISGTATLHNQTNHSGITVKMGKQVQAQTLGISAQSVTTSFTTVATTGSTGVFSFDVTMGSTSASSIHSSSIDLATGLYTVVFSKDGYESVTVDNVPVVLGQSVYNLDDVELQKSYFEFEVSTIPMDSGQAILTINNLVDYYKVEQYDDEINNSDIFFVIYTKNGTRQILEKTWAELKLMTFGIDHEGYTVSLVLHHNYNDGNVRIKITKL